MGDSDEDGIGNQNKYNKGKDQRLIKTAYTPMKKKKMGKKAFSGRADIHYIGELLGGIGFNTTDGLFAEMLIKYDNKYWNFNPVTNEKTFQIHTHTTFAKVVYYFLC
jgi:hypothetical protein